MEGNNREGTDKSSIKPVSSLLSKFEGLKNTTSASPTSVITPTTSQKPPADPPSTLPTRKQPSIPPARRSLEVTHSTTAKNHNNVSSCGAEKDDATLSARHLPQPARSTRPRPVSMQVTGSFDFNCGDQASVTATPNQAEPRSSPIQSPNRSVSQPQQELIASQTTRRNNAVPANQAPSKPTVKAREDHSQTAKINSLKQPPPPVNRASKPGISGLDLGLTPSATAISHDEQSKDTRTSPFTTPPASESSSNGEEAPPVPTASKPQILSRTTPVNGGSGSVSTAQQLVTLRPPRTSSIPLQHSEHARRRSKSDNVTPEDLEHKPQLPPRRQMAASEMSTSQRTFATGFNRQSLDLPPRSSALEQGFFPGSFPPRRESHHSLSVRNRAADTLKHRQTSMTPPPRAKVEPQFNRTFMRSSPTLTEPSRLPETNSVAPATASAAGGYPDSSKANRRPPTHDGYPSTIQTGYDTRLIDACGEYVCTSGTSTRAWHIATGNQIMNMAHPEGIKVTALSFKPSRDIDKEGSVVWLGTNFGEIMEVDITTRSVVALDDRTHSRREIVKMYRKAAEIWTLDNEGKLIVWPPDEAGSPTLNKSVPNGKTCRGVTSSVIVGNKLWLAAGKNIRVYQPNTNPAQISFEVTQEAISGPSGGDITSCAYMPSDPDNVYCGHSDGKISIFSKRNNNHVETFSVSLYKVSCLAGIGDYLWAGFNNGYIMLFDPKSRPWTTKKYWQPHTHPVVGIVPDRSSLWKLDHFHVLSLGVDSTIGVWDGVLEEDWIVDDMKAREADYCTYKDVSALILTWNAGAVKPADLRYDRQNSNFLRDLLSMQASSPDIIVFGLQELVDLEDKKLTAKNFFKGKTKDSYGHEHLSRVYREWRDYLTKCLDECVPREESYVQLHTSSLVGLFTCVFVRTSHRARIRDLVGTEIKTGMGGLHGNKGSLVVRFTLDDTSICLANCHLAAGQTATVHRNHDVQAILGSECLPPGKKADIAFGTYVYGGDGSMVMDHEICILNGDLNYRIDTMSRDTVVQAIKGKNLQKLLERDQLLLSRKKNPDFRLRDFHEAPIGFLPTYKYDIGTDNYDSSDKRRAPAWCDRVLCRGDKAIQPLEYRRHEIRVSDHRPVSATFRIQIKTRQPDACSQVRLASEKRFQKLKRNMADDSKTEYLRSVFGVSEQEARQLLKAG